jgi:alkylation response protein AidB-like acyl-CoA dehydrogenase
MRYHPDPEQHDLASAFADTVAALLPVERLRESRTESATTVAGLDEAGLFGLAAAEEHGGSGLGATEEALIMIAVGRQLAAPNVVATVGAGPAIAGSVGFANGKAPRVAAAYTHNGRTIVVDGGGADYLFVRDGDDARVHPAGDLKIIDQGSFLSPLAEAGALAAPVASVGNNGALRLRLIDAAVLAGISDGALRLAVEYAKMREQFGRPIGTFQAVKHHAANMAIAAACARDQVAYAAVALDDGRDDAALQVEAALLVAGQAAVGNAGLCIQVHGGIGFSDEADPHLYLKRAQTILAIAGGLEACAERIAAIPPMLAAA